MHLPALFFFNVGLREDLDEVESMSGWLCPLWQQRSVQRASEAPGEVTLWLCQNSYGKWPFIVDLPIENGDFP